MNNYMKCMRLHKPDSIKNNPLQWEETAVPQPGPGQLRVKVTMCGVCHTDLHIVEGELPLPQVPIIPGHQIVGHVESLGSGSTLHNIGDRVGIAWLNWACGTCIYCRNGLENLCEYAHFTGLNAAGGYAEFMIIDERFAFHLPEIFDDAQAAPLLCAGIIGYRSLKLSGIQHGGKLGLYGFGASAHLTIQVALHWNCDVFVFTRSQEHQEHALELGARWAGKAQDQPPELLDASVTFAPVGWIIPLALGHLKPGGTLAINAIHLSPIPELPYQLLYNERVLRSVANFTRLDAQEFLQTAAEIPLKSTVQVYQMQEANAVLQRLKNSQIRGAAVLSW